MCPVDDSVACLTSSNQLVQLAVPEADRKGVFSGLQQLAPGFHAGEISGLATCCRRPIVATAGGGGGGAGRGDRSSTLRIWNYRDRSVELVRCAARRCDVLCGAVPRFCGDTILHAHALPHPPSAQVKSFAEPITSLALHPGGYLLLAGFADRLRLMTVLAGGWGRGGQLAGCSACL